MAGLKSGYSLENGQDTNKISICLFIRYVLVSANLRLPIYQIYQIIIKSTHRKMDKSFFFKALVIIAVGSSGAALLHEWNISLVSIQFM
jgi:hypothetical protein